MNIDQRLKYIPFNPKKAGLVTKLAGIISGNTSFRETLRHQYAASAFIYKKTLYI